MLAPLTSLDVSRINDPALNENQRTLDNSISFPISLKHEQFRKDQTENQEWPEHLLRRGGKLLAQTRF
jgi:hypothetical protein